MKKVFQDLHLHDKMSDGTYDTTTLLTKVADICKKKAKVINFEPKIFAAITNHDTVNTVEDATKIAPGLGIEQYISGVEVSTYDGSTVHLLCYGFKCSEFKKIEEKLKPIREARTRYVQGIIDAAHEKKQWYKIGFEHILEKNGVKSSYISQVHLAYELISQYPDEFSTVEATLKQIKIASKRFESPLTPAEGAILMHKFGAEIAIGHPKEMGKEETEEETLIRELKPHGLSAIEAITTKNTEQDMLKYIRLARKYDLKITMGTDFHGEEVKAGISLGLKIDDLITEAICEELKMSFEQIYSMFLFR